MQAASTAFGLVVAGNSAVVEDQVTIVLPGGVYPDVSLAVESIEVDRSMVTDMPDGTRSITGYPSAQATVVLSGLVDKTDATKTAAWLFNPWDPTSPLYRLDALGCAITIKHGFYTGAATAETITTFTGVIDDYLIDSEAGTVTLTCLDNRGKLASAPNLPAISALLGPGAGPGLYGSYAIEYLLRSNGIYSSPPPRAGCVFYASMHGSAFPEIWGDVYTGGSATNELSNAQSYTMVPGVWGTQVAALPSIFIQMAGSVSTYTGGGYFIEFWAKLDPSVAGRLAIDIWPGPSSQYNDVGSELDITWAIGATSATVQLVTDRDLTGLISATVSSVSSTIPVDGAWHQISIMMAFPTATTATVTVWADHGTASVTNVTGLPTFVVLAASVASFIGFSNTKSPIESFQVCTLATTTPLTAFTPTAYLDPSLNPMVAIPVVESGDAWSALQQIVEAEQGVAGFDELGVFRFYNRTTLKSRTTARTITSAASLKSIQSEMAASTIANHVQVPVNSLLIQIGTLWSATAVIAVATGSTYSTVVSTLNPYTFVSIDGGYAPITTSQADGTTYWRACTTADGTGAAITTGISVVSTPLGPTSLAVKITNTSGQTAYLVNPTGAPDGDVGTPTLSIGGFYATTTVTALDGSTSDGSQTADAQYPDISQGGAAANRRGEKLLVLPANPWIQILAVAQQLAQDVVSDLSSPRPLLRNMSIVADPRLQISDRVTVLDPDSSKMAADCVLFGLTLTSSKTEWNQTVDARAVTMPGAWLLGITGSTELGITTYLT